MERILTALSASTVLFGAMLAPSASASAGASVGPGHGPGATAAQVEHGTISPVKHDIASPVKHDIALPVKPGTTLPVKPDTTLPVKPDTPISLTPLGARISAIKVVSLGASFSPPSAALSPGEPLIIIVSHSVRATLKIASGGSLVYDGRDGNVYLFFARKPGMSVVSAQVRPRCQTTKACPQWRTAPDLMVTTY